MTKTALSGVDTMWWRSDDPTNPMMITGMIVLGKPVEYERLMVSLEHGLARFERFRQRVVGPKGRLRRYYWVDDPGFDLEDHIVRVELDAPADQAVLQDAVSELASTRLDPNKPLWQLHVVEKFGKGSAIICRLHHCMGDGVALVHVLLSLSDSAQPSGGEGRLRRWNAWSPLFPRARAIAGFTFRATRTVVSEGWRVWRRPERRYELAFLGARGTAAFARLLLRWPDPKTALKGELGESKRVAWSDSFPLDDVKTIGRARGGTVNDVLVTAVAGGLRRYLQGRGEPVDGLTFRAIIPVNLRPISVEPDAGNHFGFVFLSLPVGMAGPDERLQAMSRRMDALKDSLEAPVAFGVLHIIGLVPVGLQDTAVRLFGAKCTVVITNVIGPRDAIQVAGAPVDSLMFWVPQSARLGIGVSVFSYDGCVHLGVATDEGLVPNPEQIVAGFQAEFDSLLGAARELDATASLVQLSADLDRVSASLDALLESKAASMAPEDASPDRCQALTKAGQPCKNRPLEGTLYCHVHQAN